MVAYSDEFLRQILQSTTSIAMMGISTNPVRPSYFVGRYLDLKGFDVIPVNPNAVGQEIFGKTVLGSLSEITQAVDMVDIFRRSEYVPDIVEEALCGLRGLQTVWMQIGVKHSGAAENVAARGLNVIQNRCPKIEYQRLFGELRMGGFATGVISSKF
ncbi:MAG: CoA-binding protein [Aestuariivita sp.]|nr:CoA-binding protein [Aestuariivita sp.]